MGFVSKQLVGAKLLFFSLLGQPVNLLLGEQQMTTKNFQKQKFSMQRCPLEETADVNTVFLKLQATLYLFLPGKTQKTGISTEGSRAAGCTMPRG